MAVSIRRSSLFALLLACSQAYSINHLPGHFSLEAGYYVSTQGKTQNVNIQGLIGDHYYASTSRDSNLVFGVGYLTEGIKRERFDIEYGVNAYYFAKNKAYGTITQEQLFTNLAYSYYVSHLPVYATAKANIKTNSDNDVVTVDAGVGPNFMEAGGYSDWSLDGGITQPDNAFITHSTVTLSAMAGVGIKMNQTGKILFEVGYRFFYLGEGSLNSRSSQITTSLKTGNINAQALVVTFNLV